MSLGAMQDWPLRVTRLIDHAEREHATREVVSARADGSTIRTDWKHLAHDSRRMAQALERLGVQKGDRVATLAMNHDRHLISWFGVIGAGAVLHTLNPRLFDDQLEFIVNHAEDRVLLYDAAFVPLVERMKARWPTIEHYVCYDSEFDGWLEAEDGNYQWVEGDERDPCGLCYTSGTTGDPKGVLYEHRSTVLHAMTVIAPDVFNVSARSVMLPIVPMFHANSWCIPYAAAIAGFKLVMCSDNRPDRLCALFDEEGVTHSAGVPTVWLGMIEHIEETALLHQRTRDGGDWWSRGAAFHDPLAARPRGPGKSPLGNDGDVARRDRRRPPIRLGLDDRGRADSLHLPCRSRRVRGRAQDRGRRGPRAAA